MEQLKAIEKLYASHHSSRTGKLPRFHSALEEAVNASKARLLEELCAEPLEAITAKNAQLDAEVQGLKERLATPASAAGGKKSGGGDKAKSAEVQAQLAAAQEKA